MAGTGILFIVLVLLEIAVITAIAVYYSKKHKENTKYKLTRNIVFSVIANIVFIIPFFILTLFLSSTAVKYNESYPMEIKFVIDKNQAESVYEISVYRINQGGEFIEEFTAPIESEETVTFDYRNNTLTFEIDGDPTIVSCTILQPPQNNDEENDNVSTSYSQPLNNNAIIIGGILIFAISMVLIWGTYNSQYNFEVKQILRQEEENKIIEKHNLQTAPVGIKPPPRPIPPRPPKNET